MVQIGSDVQLSSGKTNFICRGSMPLYSMSSDAQLAYVDRLLRYAQSMYPKCLRYGIDLLTVWIDQRIRARTNVLKAY
jgi:hypothetical protein